MCRTTNKVLARVFVFTLAGWLGIGALRADLVSDGTISAFRVSGLWAEDLNAETYREGGKFFEAGIYHKPLVEPRRRVPIVAPPAGMSSGIEVAPTSARAAESFRTAEAYAAGQDWKMALASIQTALDEQPNNLMLLRRAAAYAALARKFGVADEYFRRALELDPNDVAFLAGRAGVLLRLARLQEAEQLAEKALSIQPRYLSARFVLTCSRIARDADIRETGPWERLFTEQVSEVAQWLDADRADYEAVMTPAGFQKACEVMVGPGSGQRIGETAALLKRAVGLLQRRQWQDALMVLQQLDEMQLRAVGIKMDIARCLFESDKREEAEQRLRDLAQRHPDMPILHFNHGVALIRLSRFKEAAAVLETALKLDPNSNYSFFALACCYAGMGDMNKAWSYMERIAPEYRGLVEEWAKGDDGYLQALRNDPRYAAFVKSGGTP